MPPYDETDEDKLVTVGKVAPGRYNVRCYFCDDLLAEVDALDYFGDLESLARDLHSCVGEDNE